MYFICKEMSKNTYPGLKEKEIQAHCINSLYKKICRAIYRGHVDDKDMPH